MIRLSGNADFFVVILLIVGATLVGIAWAIAWAVVNV